MGIFGDLFGDYSGLFSFDNMGLSIWEEKLNKLYWTDSIEYLRTLKDIKSKGYKVLRNSKGEHKIQIKY